MDSLAAKTLKKRDFQWIYALEPMVTACCRSIGLNAEQVEEAKAETFLAALKGAPKFQDRAAPSTWLWRIAYYQAVNILRRQVRDQGNVPLDESFYASSHVEPWQYLDRDETQATVQDAVSRLPRLWSTAIHRFYWEGKSTRQIAREMKVTDQAVRVYLFRGRRRLRDLLSETCAA